MPVLFLQKLATDKRVVHVREKDGSQLITLTNNFFLCFQVLVLNGSKLAPTFVVISSTFLVPLHCTIQVLLRTSFSSVQGESNLSMCNSPTIENGIEKQLPDYT